MPAETSSEVTTAENQLLVKFSKTASDDEIEAINRRLGVRVVDRMLDGSLFLVEIPYPGTRDDIISAYLATEGVVYAEPNQRVSIPTPPAEVEGTPQPREDSSGKGSSPLIELPKVD